ncbi:hypothetical protein BDR07DRAFT_1403173 [Suillus spraguei]|nr:hypothetical protein BDR07DRAFT_1403173 [Suillus spraguei]
MALYYDVLCKSKCTLIQSRASSLFCNTYFTRLRVSKRDQISISILLILARSAEWWTVVYLARTLDCYTPQHTPLTYADPSNMTVVSNDPSWWPYIGWNIVYSYWLVAAGVVVAYDWVLTLGREYLITGTANSLRMVLS